VLATVVAACSGGSGHPAPTSSTPAPYLAGDPSRIAVTGPAQKPIHWTLLATASAAQKAVETALQQVDAFAAVQATRGVQPGDAAMADVLQNGPGSAVIGGIETLEGYPGAGVVWENVALVRVTGSTALTTICRDVRTISATVPATVTPAPGASLTAAHRVVDAVTYQWRFGQSINTHDKTSPKRWRFMTATSGPTGSPSIAQCQAQAAAHETWPGPSAG
jgi:hypothetical protein